MPNTIKIKRNSSGTPSSLAAGELAVNTTNGNLYCGNTAENGVLHLNPAFNGTLSGNLTLATSLSSASGDLELHRAGSNRLTLSGSSVVINDSGANIDFRVEGDGDANLIRTDASNDRVGIKTNAPAYTFHCVGTGYFSQAVTLSSSLTASGTITGSSGVSITGSSSFEGAAFSSIITATGASIGSTSVNKTLSVVFARTGTNVTEDGLSGGGAGKGLMIYNTTEADNVYANLDFRARNADGRIAYQYTNATNKGDFHFITDNTGSPAIKMTLKNEGNLLLGDDTDAYANIGRARVGHNEADNDYASFSHRDKASGSSYALMQSAAGATFLNSASGQQIYFRVNNSTKMSLSAAGTVTVNNNLTVAGSCTFAALSGTTANFSGTVTCNGSIDLQDNDKLLLGAGNDLEIYHNSGDSFISDVGTGNLVISGSGVWIKNAALNANMIGCVEGSYVKLFHNNNERFVTTSTGAAVTGDLLVTSNLLVGNTAVHLASAYSNQKGFSVNASTGRTDAVGNNVEGLQVGRYGGGGAIQVWRYASNQIGAISNSELTLNVPLTATGGTISGGLTVNKNVGNGQPTDATSSIYLNDQSSLAAGIGGSIVFGGRYSTNNFLGGGPYIRGVKINATSADYSFGLAFGVRKNAVGSSTEVARFDEDGNFGINCTPIYKLQVNGDARVTGSGDVIIDDARSVRWGGTKAKIVGSTGGNYLKFYTNTTERLRIDNTGVVPPYDAGESLGAANNRWLNVFATRFRAGDGNAGNPGITFINDLNTGLYRSANDTMHLVTGGASRIAVSNTSIDAYTHFRPYNNNQYTCGTSANRWSNVYSNAINVTAPSSTATYVTLDTSTCGYDTGIVFNECGNNRYALTHTASDDSFGIYKYLSTAGFVLKVKSNGETHIGSDAQGVAIHGSTSGLGSIVGVNRAGSAYKALEINASPVYLKHAGATKFQTTATGVTLSGISTVTDSATITTLNVNNTSGHIRHIDFARTSYATARIQVLEPAASHTGSMSFWTSNASGGPNLVEAMKIDQNQNIGIGMSPSSTYRLAVTGTTGTPVQILSTNDNCNVVVGSSTQTQYSNIQLHDNGGDAQIWKAGTAFSGYGGANSLNIYCSNGKIAFHPNGAANKVVINTDGTLTIGAFTIPNTDGSANQVLKTNGSGTLSWADQSGGGGGGGIGGSGTQNYIPKFTGSTTLGNSTIQHSAAGNYTGFGLQPSYNVHVLGTIAAQDSVGTVALIGTVNGKTIHLRSDAGVFKIRNATDGNELYHLKTGSSGYHKWYIADSLKMTLNSSGLLTIGTITLPNTDGSPNQVLKTNGNGTLSWVNQSGGISGCEKIVVWNYPAGNSSGVSFSGSSATGTATITHNLNTQYVVVSAIDINGHDTTAAGEQVDMGYNLIVKCPTVNTITLHWDDASGPSSQAEFRVKIIG